MKYRVTLYQTVKKEFVVMAADEDEAMEQALNTPDSEADVIQVIDDEVEEIDKEEENDMDDDSEWGEEDERDPHQEEDESDDSDEVVMNQNL